MLRFALVATLAGCTSGSRPLESLEVRLDVELHDDRLSIEMSMQNPDPLEGGPYVLAPDESLRAKFRGQTVTLDPDRQQDNFAVYATLLTPDPPLAADEPIVATFDRDGDDVELTATSTDDFALQAPASSPQPVTVTWSPTAADRMRWVSTSTAAPSANGAIQFDTGQLVFPPGVLAPAPLAAATSVTVDMARTRESMPRTAFGPVPVQFSRWHEVTIEVTP